MLHSEVKLKRTNKGGAAHYMHRLGYAVSLFYEFHWNNTVWLCWCFLCLICHQPSHLSFTIETHCVIHGIYILHVDLAMQAWDNALGEAVPHKHNTPQHESHSLHSMNLIHSTGTQERPCSAWTWITIFNSLVPLLLLQKIHSYID